MFLFSYCLQLDTYIFAKVHEQVLTVLFADNVNGNILVQFANLICKRKPKLSIIKLHEF